MIGFFDFAEFYTSFFNAIELLFTAFSAYLDTVDIVLKVITAVTIPPTIILLFLRFHKHYRLVYGFFKKYGIGRWQSLGIVIASRKNMEINLRSFIEFSIFRISGEHSESNEWNLIIDVFKAQFIKNVNVNYVLTLADTFVLKNDYIATRIEEYLELLMTPRAQSTLAIDATKPIQFFCEIHIENGYSVPLVPIASLHQQDGDDWTQVSNLYTMSCLERKMYPFEVASFYVWLMWIPSVCLTDESSEYKLCAYGLGDESLVIPMIITNTSQEAEELWENILQRNQKYSFGVFIKGTFRLMKSDSYMDHNRVKFSENSAKYCENVQTNNVFLLEHINHDILYAKEGLFTAYIWVMIYYTTEQEQAFDCQRCTAFFEHANLANNQTVEILVQSLKRKVVLAFEQIFQDEANHDRTYYIPWSLDKSVYNEVAQEILRLQADKEYRFHDLFKTNICLDGCRINADEILNNIDDVFDEDYMAQTYRHIDFDDPADLTLLASFYFDIYVKEFPNENERESLENIIKQAKRFKNSSADVSYHCILAIQDSKVIGGIIGDYFASINSAAIEFVTIDSRYRRRGGATKLISKFIGYCDRDATRVLNKPGIDYYFFEVERQDMAPDEVEQEIRNKRLAFWARNAAKTLDFKYRQPSIDATKQPVDDLWLSIRVMNGTANVIEGDFILSFLYEYFTHAFGIENAKELPIYGELAERLQGKPIKMKHIDNV